MSHRSAPDPLRVCLVSASGQNVFFSEILEALGGTLRDRGLAIEESVDCFPEAADDLVYLFVPHEYEPMVEVLAHPSDVQLSRSVAVCTEQPGTRWFETACGVAARAGGVVDINALGMREMRSRGIEGAHVPLGYVPSWDAWGGSDDRERPIDLTFLGAYTERRAHSLAACAPALTLTERRASIHLTESAQPHTAGNGYFLSGARKWRHLADSKVLLNVHQQELAYMEWHRIVGAIANGCVVLSEQSPETEPLVPGEHFISACYRDLPNVLEALLAEPERLSQIRQAAYALLRGEMPMANSAEGLLSEVERAAGNEVPPKRPVGVASATVPMPVPPSARTPEWEAYVTHTGETLPMRMALKHLVVGMKGIERRLDALAADKDTEPDTVEHLGPELESPRVSVLLTVHNYADHVGAALRSVAVCELPNVEVVAVDDASTDGSVGAIRAVCDECPWLPVTLVRRGLNQGLPAARNLALEHARAELVFILDADNAVLPQGPSKLADALDENPDAAFAYGVIETFDVNGPVALMNWHHWDPARLRHGNYIDAMAMIRRSALEAAGGYSTDTVFAGGWEDFALWVAMADAGMSGVRVPDFVARYRVSPHSMISLSNVDSTAVWSALLRKHRVLTQS